MSQKSNSNSSREALLDTAEQLFASRGYGAVTLKDIAKQLDIKQASLYYHFPGGKEDLFVEVMLRHLERRKQVLEQIIATESGTLEGCLLKLATWLWDQPPLNALRIIRTDLPEISPQKAIKIETAIGLCVLRPVEELFVRHQPELRGDPGFIAGMFLSGIEPLSTVQQYSTKTKDEMIAELISVLLYGALERP